MYQSRYNSSVFLSMYQSRYNSLCILKYVSIQIQLSVFFSMYQFRYNSLYSLVCINPNTTLCILKYVLMQIQLALKLYTHYMSTNTFVCIKELGNIKSRHWDLNAKPNASIGFKKKPQNVVFSII